MIEYTHTIHLPQPLPQPFTRWSRDWQLWLESINTRPVRIKNRLRMPSPAGFVGGHLTYFDGYEVEADVTRPAAKIAWVRATWLVPIQARTDPSISECNCDARDLFNFGCRGH